MSEHKPFSFDTIENFDEHIDLSIPDYSTLIKHVLNISTYFVKEFETVYDFGASTGKLLELMRSKHNLKVDYVGVDKSPNFRSELVVQANLDSYPIDAHCFSTSIFTLQFMPRADRSLLLKKIYLNLNKGGALIVAEKIYSEDGFLQDLLTFAHYDFKRESFSNEQIFNKQQDLRYIMSPLSEKENMKMFRKAGFSRIASFWSSLSFKAWILIK